MSPETGLFGEWEEIGEFGGLGEFGGVGEFAMESSEAYPEIGLETAEGAEVGVAAAAGRAALALSSNLRAQIQKHRDAHARLMRAVEAMKKHIAVRNGRLHFTLPARSAAEAAARLGIDPKLFSHLHRSIRHRNVRLARAVAMQGAAPRRVTVSSEIQMEDGTCAGVTKSETVWWGLRLWLDECKTQSLVSALKGAGSASAVCAAAFGAEAALACGLIGVSGVLVDSIDKWGGNQGVILSWTWLQISGAIATPIVTSQGS